jgi:dihydroorotate dehydrogenase (NAD+) catalytic subunit
VNDALEFLIAGASTVGVGTALFYDPLVCKKINEGIAAYLAKHTMQSVSELIGTSSAHPPLELPTRHPSSAL